MSLNILESRKIENAYRSVVEGCETPEPFRRPRRGRGRKIEESEGTYEMAFKRLLHDIYDDGGVSESKAGLCEGEWTDDELDSGEAPVVATGAPDEVAAANADAKAAANGSDDEIYGDDKGRLGNLPRDFLKEIERKHPFQNINQEREMIDKFVQAGDMDGLRDELVLHNMRLLRPFIRKFRMFFNNDVDNMVSIGYDALRKAAEKFDINCENGHTETGKNKFSTFAHKYIRNAYVRAQDAPGEDVSRSSTSNDAPVLNKKGDADAATFGDLLYDKVDDKARFQDKDFTEYEYRDFFKRLLDLPSEGRMRNKYVFEPPDSAGLSKFEKDVITLLYVKKLPPNEVALRFSGKSRNVKYSTNTRSVKQGEYDDGSKNIAHRPKAGDVLWSNVGKVSRFTVDKAAKRAIDKIRAALLKRGIRSSDDAINNADRLERSRPSFG